MVYEGFILQNDTEAYMHMLKIRDSYIHQKYTKPWHQFTIDLSQYLLNRTCEGMIDRSCVKTVSANKKSIREAAFRSVPQELLDKVLQIYKLDFELFGYEPYVTI